MSYRGLGQLLARAAPSCTGDIVKTYAGEPYPLGRDYALMRWYGTLPPGVVSEAALVHCPPDAWSNEVMLGFLGAPFLQGQNEERVRAALAAGLAADRLAPAVGPALAPERLRRAQRNLEALLPRSRFHKVPNEAALFGFDYVETVPVASAERSRALGDVLRGRSYEAYKAALDRVVLSVPAGAGPLPSASRPRPEDVLVVTSGEARPTRWLAAALDLLAPLARRTPLTPVVTTSPYAPAPAPRPAAPKGMSTGAKVAVGAGMLGIAALVFLL